MVVSYAPAQPAAAAGRGGPVGQRGDSRGIGRLV